jgi:hypothetical protein
MAYKVPGNITHRMYISADSATRSVRYAPTPAGDRLLVGGAGHPGGSRKEARVLGAGTGFVGEEELSRRDADALLVGPGLHSCRRIVYVGPILPGDDKIFVATGFDKWGMTNSTAAALAFASWSPHELSGIPNALQANLEVGFNLAKGWITPVLRFGDRTPSEGGVVSGPPWDMEARSVVNGVEHRVSPVCPHLGGIVNWNDADESWECPLHGSRFAPDGTLLEGPATRNLTAAR